MPLAPAPTRLVRYTTLLTMLAGCAAIGTIIDDWSTERPPLPLERAEVSSDARLDSTGAIAGSFIGEGTSRQVHLLSSDPTLVSDLVRRYRPDRDRRVDPLQWLATRGNFAINPDGVADSSLLSQPILVASPEGHTRVRLRTILLHGPRCSRGVAQSELIVEAVRSGGPSLRGPVIGSFRTPGVEWPGRETVRRDPVPEMDPGLTDTLLRLTADVMDSLLEGRLTARDVPLERTAGPVQVNSLSDEDAADVIAFRLDDGQVRYAVSLRETRRTARGTEALAAIVMVWDQSLGWRQVVFRPTLLELGRRGPTRALANRTAPLFWRRFQAISGYAAARDYLWLEQVDVTDGSVLWVILEPRSNTVVAAAEVEDAC